jgi:hypothetical protein
MNSSILTLIGLRILMAGPASLPAAPPASTPVDRVPDFHVAAAPGPPDLRQASFRVTDLPASPGLPGALPLPSGVSEVTNGFTYPAPRQLPGPGDPGVILPPRGIVPTDITPDGSSLPLLAAGLLPIGLAVLRSRKWVGSRKTE